MYHEETHLSGKLGQLFIEVVQDDKDIKEIKLLIKNSNSHLVKRVDELETRAETVSKELASLKDLVHSMNVRLYTSEDKIVHIMDHS